MARAMAFVLSRNARNSAIIPDTSSNILQR
jgi:hypothetical protein